MKLKIALSIFSVLLFSGAANALSLHPGTTVQCTSDMNQFGHPSACNCMLDEWDYNPEIGFCEEPGNTPAVGMIEGTFNMAGNRPNQTAPNCGIGETLTLETSRFRGPVAMINSYVIGMCEIYVPANNRFVELQAANAGCGSRVYTGTLETINGRVQYEILDHRTRVCRDMVPAQVIMTIKRDGARDSVLYSQYVPIGLPTPVVPIIPEIPEIPVRPFSN